MRIKVPKAAIFIMKTIHDAGFTCEIVGGAVRDVLLKVPTQDWDFTTNGTPEQILPLFQESFYENAFGTVMVAQKHLEQQFSFHDETNENLIYDITTYRSDGVYHDHRKPEQVTWGKTIEEDLKRRDFTINAMALRADLAGDGTEGEYEFAIIDPFNGQADLQKRIIRTVGDPDERFIEDALRMLRAVRLSAQLDFSIEENVAVSIRTHASTLQHISSERIRDELLKILASPLAEYGIRLLDQVGLLAFIIPELLPMKGMRQSGHHIYDVWEHSLKALGTCPSSDPVIRLATLLHDIGKPLTYQEKSKDTVTFYSHEVIGARTARDIARRLHFSKQEVDKIFLLVRWHMFTYDRDVTDAYIRRFIRRVGIENIEDMIALRTADRLGSGSSATSWRLEELQKRIYEQLHQPLQVTDLVIDGNDVMKELNISPGPVIGTILNALFEDVLEHPEHNIKDYLLERVRTEFTKQ